MKPTLYLTLTAVAMFLMTVGAPAQQPATLSITEARKQIQELKVIEQNESATEDVKTLNKKFIDDREVRLHALLAQRVAALRKYLSSVNSILQPDERATVEATVRDLEQELKDLDGEIAVRMRSAAGGSQPPSSGESISPPKSQLNSGGSRPNDNLLNGGETKSATAVPDRRTQTATTASGDDKAAQLQAEIDADKNRMIAEVKRKVSGQVGDSRIREADVFAPTFKPVFWARILSMKALPRTQFNGEIESARVDKQVGGAASNAGSTSLVSKGSVPGILGFAVENGGLTRTNEGTTITFRGNPVGLVNAFAGKGFIDSYTNEDSLTIKRLRKFSFALSYDTSLGSTPNVFVGNRQQLSSYSFRYEFFNHRDPRDARYSEKWRDLVANNAQAVANDAGKIMDLFMRDTVLRAWLESARKAIAEVTDDNVESVVRTKFNELDSLELSPTVKIAVSHFSQSFSDYREKRSELLDLVANGPIFTVDYINNRRPGLIDTSNIKFVYSTGIVKGRASVTANGDLTFFNSSPGIGKSSLRDYDFSTQIDIPLGDPRGFGQFDLSFAGQIKRVSESEEINGTPLTNKGNIGTFNLKLEIPIKNLGVKFPLAFTYSNRTEFDLKKQLRANFGFAFDPDILYNFLKPFSVK
jgi:hypothetical protein